MIYTFFELLYYTNMSYAIVSREKKGKKEKQVVFLIGGYNLTFTSDNSTFHVMWNHKDVHSPDLIKYSTDFFFFSNEKAALSHYVSAK